MSGYSDPPLAQKLGLKPGMRVHFADMPSDYFRTLGRTPTIVLMTKLKGQLDFIQQFADRRAVLETKFPSLVAALETDGMLWVSWPKQASKVATDITEDVVREIALNNGLVDVKVCAVDEVWSGLKLVRRLQDR